MSITVLFLFILISSGYCEDLIDANDFFIYRNATNILAFFVLPGSKQADDFDILYTQISYSLDNYSNITVLSIDCDTVQCNLFYFESQLPSLVWYNYNSTSYQIYSGSLTSYEVYIFIHKCYEPFNFKEYIPPIVKLEPSLFHSLIKSSHFNIPILFCQKWREKCYNFISTWNRIGEKYNENNDLIIASIDTSHYSSIEEELKIKTYPTIIIFDKNNKQIEYNKDNMNYEDIVEFINDSCGILDEDVNIKPDDDDNKYIDEVGNFTSKEEEEEEKVAIEKEEINTESENLEEEL